MSDRPLSLSQLRKRRAREQKERLAAANRARHGLSRAERRKAAAERERTEREHGGRKLEPPEEPGA